MAAFADRLPARASRWILALCLGLALGVMGSGAALAQSAGKSWNQLTPPQRAALQPLEKDWATLDAQRKQKWIEVASRFDRMPLEERARLQQRMGDWSRLSPQERNEARVNFQGVRQLSPQERQARWEAYKALPEDQRQQLVKEAKAGSSLSPRINRAEAKPGGPKVNTVSNPFLDVGKPSPVVPGVVQARPGATTRSIAARPAPPSHQHPGLPKVAATPEFVDPHTLLPRRSAPAAQAGSRAKSRE